MVATVAPMRMGPTPWPAKMASRGPDGSGQERFVAGLWLLDGAAEGAGCGAGCGASLRLQAANPKQSPTRTKRPVLCIGEAPCSTRPSGLVTGERRHPPSAMLMTAPPSLRFMFVTGKGGVGKTVLTAALARHLSSQNRRVLLAVTGGEQRFEALLGTGRIGETIREIAPNLFAVRLHPDVAVREYGAMVLKSQKLTNALFDNKYVQGFFHGALGLKEWALLGKAWFHATETLPSGAPRFDSVLFDAPATGHGLDMLRVPKVIVDVAPPGVLRHDAERAWNFFRDPAQSGVIVVTLPEEMPTNETFELVQALREELNLPIAALAVNALVEPLFDANSRALFEALEGPLDERDPAQSALAAARRRASKERVQSESLARLGTLGLPELRLPWIAGGVESPAALSKLLRAFETAPADPAPTAERK